jgi:hypothetical protein
MMIKTLATINADDILNAYKLIEDNIQWTCYGHKGRQAGLQFKDNENPWSSAVGRSSGQELSYCNLNPFFKDTVFEKVINQYNLTRTRLMWVDPFACYSMHKDETPRVHIPLITNPNCYFVFRNSKVIHLTKRIVWWVDTREMHTFMNCSDQPRLHLVGVVEK